MKTTMMAKSIGLIAVFAATTLQVAALPVDSAPAWWQGDDHLPKTYSVATSVATSFNAAASPATIVTWIVTSFTGMPWTDPDKYAVATTTAPASTTTSSDDVAFTPTHVPHSNDHLPKTIGWTSPYLADATGDGVMPVPTIAGYNQANNAHVPKVVVDVPVIEDRSVEEHPAAAINNSSNITEVALAKLLVKWVVESEAGAKGNKPVLNGDHHFNMTAADVAKLVVQVEKCPAVKRMMAEERLHG